MRNGGHDVNEEKRKPIISYREVVTSDHGRFTSPIIGDRVRPVVVVRSLSSTIGTVKVSRMPRFRTLRHFIHLYHICRMPAVFVALNSVAASPKWPMIMRSLKSNG